MFFSFLICVMVIHQLKSALRSQEIATLALLARNDGLFLKFLLTFFAKHLKFPRF